MVKLDGIGFLYIAMELADETLERRLMRGALTTLEAIDLARHIGSALAFLHDDERHLVHRDLKPANILCVGGVWKLSDYGIVRHVGAGSHAETASVKGTLAYMPPESFDGVVSPAWDVWSLGVILVEGLTGKRPFSGASDAELMRAIYTKEPEFQRSIPDKLDGIVRGCLNRNRKLRIQAGTIVGAQGTGTLIEPLPPRPTPPPPILKKRLPSWLAVLAVAVAWGVGGCLAYFGQRYFAHILR
jgi:serine/threonine protein kinase